MAMRGRTQLRASTPCPHQSVDSTCTLPHARADAMRICRYQSTSQPTVCVAGKQVALSFKSSAQVSGSDKLGAWTG